MRRFFIPLFCLTVFLFCRQQTVFAESCTTGTFKSDCGFTGQSWCTPGTSCNTGQISGPQTFATCPKNAKLINSGTYCDYGNGQYSFDGSEQCVADASCPANQSTDLNCQDISLSPAPATTHNGLPVYKGGENVTVTLRGSSYTNKLDLYWKSAYLPMSSAEGFYQIPGNLDPQSQTLTAQWTIPTVPQEILLTANNTDATGNFCSGNPCSLNAISGGYYVPGAEICGPNLPACSGCQKKIVVDPLVDLNSTNAIDVKDYMKFDPGNYWEYTSTNNTYQPAINSTLRIEVEPPTLLCGHKQIGLRFLKNKIEGYWGPVNSYQSPSHWGGNLALRWPVTGFSDDPKWSNRFIGALGGAMYNILPAPDQLKGLGAFEDNRAGYYFSSGSQHFYYPSYFQSPRFLPLDPRQWSFTRQDITFDVSIDGSSNPQNDIVASACDAENDPIWKNNYNERGHGFSTQYGWENVQTPAYSGQALRIIYLEYGSDNPANSFLLREDWFFAKNIGLVMIKSKNLDHFGLYADPCLKNSLECANAPMTNPENIITLDKYYLGKPLVISSPNWVKPGDPWQLATSDNYTGYLDIQYDVTPITGQSYSGNSISLWVDNGIVNVPGSVTSQITPGKWVQKFRRHLPDLPDNIRLKDETLDASFTNNLPWSDPVEIYFTNSPPITPTPSRLPGDLNGDGVVNKTDYDLLIPHFGQSGSAGWVKSDINNDGRVDILDFNILVGNFGK